MRRITIAGELSDLCPNIHLWTIACGVSVESCPSGLKKLMEDKCREIEHNILMQDIGNLPVIDEARKAYRACGKDPARYRLSAEALLRRIVNGKGLYHINNVVDLLNLVSVTTGFSIGGYDADAVQGDICMGIGRKTEPYEGLGRGDLNIAHMPVFRDNLGPFGSATSDSERTGVSASTKRFLMIFISFNGNKGLNEAGLMAVGLLSRYASGIDFETAEITSKGTCAATPVIP